MGILAPPGLSHTYGTGYYYYDMPVSINGKQMGLPNNSYAKQERNNLGKKGGSTGGLLLSTQPQTGTAMLYHHPSGIHEYSSGSNAG